MTVPSARLALFTLISLISAFSFSSAIAAAAPPGQIEYGYENVPDPGSGKGNDSSNGQGSGVNGDSGSGDASSGNGEGQEGMGADGKPLSAEEKRLVEVSGADEGFVNEKTALTASVNGTGDEGSGGPSAVLIVALAAVAAAVGGAYFMRKRQS